MKTNCCNVKSSMVYLIQEVNKTKKGERQKMSINTWVELEMEIGNIVPPEAFETEAEAEQEGFYWDDELGLWVNMNKVNTPY